MRRCLVTALQGAVVAVSALALAGCGASDPVSQPATPAASAPGTSSAYVALGDSYSAAPGVPALDLASGCLRSSRNYPHLIAADVPGVRLNDVTCSAATTASLVEPQRTLAGISVAPQLDALSPTTRYVTLGIGGNDFGLYGAMTNCLRHGACATSVGDGIDRTIDTIGQRLTRALQAIHRKAPDAKVALVGYPQLMSVSGPCPVLRHLTAADRAFVHTVFVRFSQRMARAAHDGAAAFVDVLTASQGHDICSADPWVDGPVANDRAFAFHPYGTEQRAIATLVEQAFGLLSAR